jgi:transposase InsO family protein
MSNNNEKNVQERWARLRFLVVGPLLACPSEKLANDLRALAAKEWKHPTEDRLVKFGQSTIERWYYKAKRSQRPFADLGRQTRSDAGCRRALSAELEAELLKQHKNNPNWTYRLHFDNLAVVAAQKEQPADMPSYQTVRRHMQSKGWFKRRQLNNKTLGEQNAARRLEKCEVRGYEVAHVHALWHLDFHHGSLRVIDANGVWQTPICLCILDDHSRLVCHIQWYLHETAEVLIHGLCQAFQKRGLPRSLMTDNGAAMVASETTNGLMELSIVHSTTLPYSPYQNGKQESFWGRLEGRLMAMMQHNPELTLKDLNVTTLAWVEQEYHRSVHSDLKTTPLDAMLKGNCVERPCPDVEQLRFAFTQKVPRTQRRSDGTLSLEGIRFEVPSHLRHVNRLWVRFRRWDLSSATIVDERDYKAILAHIRPVDKTKNADGRRRTLEATIEESVKVSIEAPPLLQKIMADFAATGLPPAYIPHEEEVACDK